MVSNDEDQIIVWMPNVEKARVLVGKGLLPGRAEGKDDVVLSTLDARELNFINSDQSGALFDWKSRWFFGA